MHYYFEEVLKLGKEASQYYSGIPLLVMAASMPVGGWLSDRLVQAYGRRVGRALVPAGGMLASAGLLLLGIFAHDPIWIVTWFSLAMGAVGAAESPFWTTAIELGGRRGGTSGAIVNTGGNAGGLIAPILTPWVGTQFGWPWAISLSGIYCLLGMGLWAWIDPDERLED
jgi:MFS family permease